MKRSTKISGPRLFHEPAPPAAHAEGAFTAHIDGAARGNPGPASYGVVILRPDGQPAEQLRKYLGRTTNNVAEYYALIAALDYTAAHGIRKLRVRSDSELLVQQMKGIYKVKSAELRPLHERAKKLAVALEYFHIEHVPREQNRAADALANAALDSPGSDRLALCGTHHERSRGSRAGFSETAAGLKPARPAGGSAPTQSVRRVRVVYRNGALHPAEPLDLPDGAEVEITLHAPRHK